MMNSKERAYLRSCAQTLDPIVYVGKEGLTDGVVNALSQAIDAHELVKIRFQSSKDEVREISEELASRTGSALVSITGFTSVVYKAKENPLERMYRV